MSTDRGKLKRGQPTADSRQPTADSRQPTADEGSRAAAENLRAVVQCRTGQCPSDEASALA